VKAREPVRGRAVPAERKLITLLSCELDQIADDDPEDPAGQVASHLAMVRLEIARHGGVTSHVVGNAVLALFGVPRVRDDDAERAVRAAFAVLGTVGGRRDSGRHRAAAPVRVAVATGEALVNLAELRDGTGPGVAGDVVSLAISVKDAAPSGTVLVTAETMRATERVISYAPDRLLPLPGAREPAAVWDALAPRPHSRRAPGQPLGAPLVGRQDDLDLLLSRFAQVCRDGMPHLVVLTGPSGIGKSRLLAEFGRIVAARPDPPRWRAGRSYAFGLERSVWALAEVVKAEADILDSDPVEEAERKLAEAAGAALDDHATADWVRRELRRLIGVEPDGQVRPDASAAQGQGDPSSRRDEVFGAWRRFVYALASKGPLVLALEDLHWANDALLGLLESLIDGRLVDPDLAQQPQQSDRRGSIPLLVVATARPELLARRPGWATSSAARTTVPLGPLSDTETASLLGMLLAARELPPAVGAEVLERAGGNPLFAEEYARMLRDQTRAEIGPGQELLATPTTVQAVIAARLESLPVEERAVLRDAAVLGRVSWLGAIAAIGGHDRRDLDGLLSRLEDKELLRRLPWSRVAGEAEVEFRHVTVRDVAYSQVPRLARAECHRRAAGWLQQLTADRVADRAELLAHHYVQALSLVRSAGLDDAELVEETVLALGHAGDHASALGIHTTAASRGGVRSLV
jgi:class 3 adenylate cyclase